MAAAQASAGAYGAPPKELPERTEEEATVRRLPREERTQNKLRRRLATVNNPSSSLRKEVSSPLLY
jgi:hypothetical protein